MSIRATFVAISLAIGLAAGSWSPAVKAPDEGGPTVGPPLAAAGPPVLAYFYQWFDAGSWNRAKIDYPAVGRYSSDDPTSFASRSVRPRPPESRDSSSAGRAPPTNNRRLRLLMTIAAEEQFKLAMIYQGLDFNRQPLPVASGGGGLRRSSGTRSPTIRSSSGWMASR